MNPNVVYFGHSVLTLVPYKVPRSPVFNSFDVIMTCTLKILYKSVRKIGFELKIVQKAH